MGELLLVEGKEGIEVAWSVEKRFRVTEVFLAVLWVWISSFWRGKGGIYWWMRGVKDG